MLVRLKPDPHCKQIGCCRASARHSSPHRRPSMPSAVIDPAPADSAAALAHFESSFRFETDCWDVNDAMSNGRQDFLLVDVRSPDLYTNGHAPGAINIPQRKLIES